MDIATQQNSGSRLLQTVTGYSLHLLTAVLGSMLLGALAAFFLLLIWGATSRNADAQVIRSVLLHRPFPLQLVAALLLGIFVAPRLSPPSPARWVWIVPSVALLIHLVSWKPYSTLIAETPWHHFFGSCVRLYCPEQFTVTLPFYASLAYSLGYIIRAATRPEKL